MVIPVGSDHAGFELKTFVVSILQKWGYEVKDYGTYSVDSVDYPDFIHHVAASVDSGKYQTGVVICGSGQGASMVANKYAAVRCALCWSPEQASLSRMHNNANVISLPARFIDHETAAIILQTFLDTPFEGGRHEKRVNKIALH